MRLLTKATLRSLADSFGVRDFLKMTKDELVESVYVELKKRRKKKEVVLVPLVYARPKTQEELTEEYRNRYKDFEQSTFIRSFFDPIRIDNDKKPDGNGGTDAKLSDVPPQPFQTLEEIRGELQTRQDSLLRIEKEDGTYFYIGVPFDQNGNNKLMRKYMELLSEKEELTKKETETSATTKRKYTRKKKEPTEEEKTIEELKNDPDFDFSKPTKEEEEAIFGKKEEVAEPQESVSTPDTSAEQKGGDEASEKENITSARRAYAGKKNTRAQLSYSRNGKTDDSYLNKKKQFNGSQDNEIKADIKEVKENKETEEDVDSAPIEYKEGVLEIMADGYGFLRAKNYESGEHDAYVSAQRIRRSGLRKGDYVKAEAKQICDNRPAGVVNVLEVNGCPPESAFHRKNFDSLTPIYPDQRFRLEIPGRSTDFAIRCIDLVAPIGKGQRSMIVSPPKAGKTTLLKSIANSISINYPDAHLMVLLVDERPEEVTDMKRSIKGEVIYSTFDETPEHHTKAAELVLERAKRLVEMDKDVVILMDSLTRLARAYNLTISPTGRTLSGGIDPGALHSPKRFFGAARNIENGGSLTIIATALVDTGSRMDDVIYEEFKGTGNMEIHLDRRLSERRIFPAIDLYRSGTRRDEMLLDQDEIGGIWGVRKMLSAGGDTSDSTETLINMMIKTKTNKEFIEQLNLQLKRMKDNGYLV